MPQANFAYSSPANDAAGLPLALSIFADRGHVRDLLREDAEAAGFRIAEAGDVAALLEGDARPLGEEVLLDCPAVDGAGLAALARLDLRAANCGAHLIVSTTVAALDDVFGLVLLRLTEQVGQIAQRLERLEGPERSRADGRDSVFRFESPSTAFAPSSGDGSERLVRAARPPLPDPRLVRRIIRQRQLRARFFDGDLFADPAWDMLLDLTAARAEHARVSVTSLCIASGVPPTTALRWIGQMTDAGLLQRVEDETDRRRAFITLSDQAADGMARYFAELGSQAAALV
ncbi:MAG: winged helix DNA-binding protein [Novosphingobium sp.]|nr:winged helix DNA-binding protein [Novosphingobium sp.]